LACTSGVRKTVPLIPREHLRMLDRWKRQVAISLLARLEIAGELRPPISCATILTDAKHGIAHLLVERPERTNDALNGSLDPFEENGSRVHGWNLARNASALPSAARCAQSHTRPTGSFQRLGKEWN
jgi:hypothetical protein